MKRFKKDYIETVIRFYKVHKDLTLARSLAYGNLYKKYGFNYLKTTLFSNNDYDVEIIKKLRKQGGLK